jgi:chromosome segregation ATPase
MLHTLAAFAIQANADRARLEGERDAADRLATDISETAAVANRLREEAEARAEQAEAALAVKDARKSDGWYRAYQRALEQAQEHIDALAAKDARIAELEGAFGLLKRDLEHANDWSDRYRQQLTALEADVRALRCALSRASNSLRLIGDDYPGSSCHDWCHRAADDADTVLLAARTAPQAPDPSRCNHDVTCSTCGTRFPPEAP